MYESLMLMEGKLHCRCPVIVKGRSSSLDALTRLVVAPSPIVNGKTYTVKFSAASISIFSPAHLKG